MKEITEEILLKDATPWYLQIVSRYEHSDLTYDCTEGNVEFPGTSTPNLRAIVRREVLCFPVFSSDLTLRPKSVFPFG